MSQSNTIDTEPQSTQAVTIQTTHATATVGPIPDAESLEAYGRVRENLPDIIIEEWRLETAMRRELTRKNAELAEREITLKEKAVTHVHQHEILRLILGGLFVGGALYLSWLLAMNDKTESAIAIATIPVIGAIVSAGIKLFKK